MNAAEPGRGPLGFIQNLERETGTRLAFCLHYLNGGAATGYQAHQPTATASL